MTWFRRDPGRRLTHGERALAADLFGTVLDCDSVRLHRAKWWPLQPRNVVMAPAGGVWFHPDGGLWRDDYAVAHLRLQALLIHELMHVWQHQKGLCLIVRRHPFCRYDYRVEAGRPLERYGIEQQAMIVEHAFVARRGSKPDPVLEALLAGAGLIALSR